MNQPIPILKFDITPTHRAARRREQNRLNQRASRLRKRAQNTNQVDADINNNDLRKSPYGVLVPSSSGALVHQQTAAGLLDSHIPNYIVLTQLNVWQATLINSLILGISHFFTEDDDDSPTDVEDLSYIPHYISPSYSCPRESSSPHQLLKSPAKTIPSPLAPTTLQKTIPHYPWIDLIPLAGLRDSLIRAGSRLEVHEFCMDMTGDMFNTSNGNCNSMSQGGLLVWGDSWMIESWEMTEGFVRKWGWLLDEGCDEIVRSTNRWREGRGEDALIIYS